MQVIKQNNICDIIDCASNKTVHSNYCIRHKCTILTCNNKIWHMYIYCKKCMCQNTYINKCHNLRPPNKDECEKCVVTSYYKNHNYIAHNECKYNFCKKLIMPNKSYCHKHNCSIDSCINVIPIDAIINNNNKHNTNHYFAEFHDSTCFMHWRPEKHHEYPKQFKKDVFMILLTLKKIELEHTNNKNCFWKIPKFVKYEIFKQLIYDKKIEI